VPNQFSQAGAQPSKPVRFAPIWSEYFSVGYFSNRNPLRDGVSSRIAAKYYGTHNDAMIAGSNVEISNRLTVIRRPGNSVYNSATFSSIDCFYEFRLFTTNVEVIKVMADTATALYDGTGPSTQNLVWTKSTGSGQTFMQYVANILYFGNGVDQKKWIQNPQGWQASYNYTVDELQTFVIDPNGNIQQLIKCVLPVTNIAITSDVLTVTFSDNISTILTAGLPLSFNLAAATFLNNLTNQTITIASVGTTTITAAIIHPNYASTADSGTCTILQGGTPLSGTTQPSWSTQVPSSSNNYVGGLTTDHTAVWVNRGSTIENFGLAGPTQEQLTTTVQTSTNSWKADTYYSQLTAVIDSNGNLQQITTAGESGSYGTGGHPTWATTVGATTADGTVVWTCTELASSLVWQPNTAYAPGKLVVATPTNGVPSVYQLQNFSASQLSGSVSAYLYPVSHTVGVGAFSQMYPTTTGSASASATGNSLLFNPPGYNTGATSVQWATLNSAGTITGYTSPFPSYNSNYNLIILADLVIPEAGNYTLTFIHEDGMIFGLGGGATYISGPRNDPYSHTQTANLGFTVIGGNNVSGLNTDQFIVNFPTSGTYQMEIDYDFWYHQGQTLQFFLNGITPAPSGGSTSTRTTGPTAPLWPAFSTAFAPNYALVSEASGQAVWENIGYVTDFGWTPTTNYILDDTSIVDNNGYTEAPFEAGTTSQIAPTFTKTVNGLTPDNPNLTWINTGKATAIPAGSLNTYNGGWSYCVALVNTLTDTVSNAGLTTTATGSFLGASGVTISGGLPSSPDPQADYVAIFRTQDGGATYYLIPGTANQNTPYTLPLSTYLTSGYTDTTLDSALDIFFSPALAQENTPPPTGIINLTYHLGRVFGSVGNSVYWSDGPDAPIGNGYEGWPPLNTATCPSLVKKIVPTSLGALIFTVSDIYLIAGTGTSSSPLFLIPYMSGVGLLSYNALSVNGSIIYMFTADSQMVSLDPHAGISQIGFPIGDQLQTWNPANVYVTWHVNGSQDQALYVGNGSTGWFRLIPTPSPETGQCWAPFATIQGGVKAVQSVEVSPGVNRLLLGPSSSGPILERNLAVWTDNGTAYTAFFQIGSIVLAQPGQIAELGFITTDAIATGSTPAISVLIDEISGTFEEMPLWGPDPPQFGPAGVMVNSSVYAQRFYFSQTQSPAICRHLQIGVAWPAENFQNELLSITIFGGFSNE
jgi:hypothetical protein